MKNCLMIFMKYPKAGEVKTRLTTAVSPETAAKLHKAMSIEIIKNTHSEEWVTEIHITPEKDEKILKEEISENDIFMFQRGEDLGKRMLNALSDGFKRGYDNICIIGTDSPDIGNGILSQGFKCLCMGGSVIGPGFDGGYYLIGFNKDKFLPQVFDGPKWGEDSVLSATMSIFRKYNFAPHILPFLNDIDTPEDLKNFLEHEAYGTRGSKIAQMLRNILNEQKEKI